MKVRDLSPQPQCKLPFRGSFYLRVPSQSGCYVLSNFAGTILYIGLSKCLVRRFNQHLESPDKTAPTPLGKAFWFHWLLYENIEKLERTWLNAHEIAEGKLPHLNSHRSPLSI